MGQLESWSRAQLTQSEGQSLLYALIQGSEQAVSSIDCRQPLLTIDWLSHSARYACSRACLYMGPCRQRLAAGVSLIHARADNDTRPTELPLASFIRGKPASLLPSACRDWSTKGIPRSPPPPPPPPIPFSRNVHWGSASCSGMHWEVA